MQKSGSPNPSTPRFTSDDLWKPQISDACSLLCDVTVLTVFAGESRNFVTCLILGIVPIINRLHTNEVTVRY